MLKLAWWSAAHTSCELRLWSPLDLLCLPFSDPEGTRCVEVHHLASDGNETWKVPFGTRGNRGKKAVSGVRESNKTSRCRNVFLPMSNKKHDRLGCLTPLAMFNLCETQCPRQRMFQASTFLPEQDAILRHASNRDPRVSSALKASGVTSTQLMALDRVGRFGLDPALMLLENFCM